MVEHNLKRDLRYDDPFVHPYKLVQDFDPSAIHDRYAGDAHAAGGVDHLAIQGDDIECGVWRGFLGVGVCQDGTGRRKGMPGVKIIRV
jgi:hypothetical protein